MDGQQGKVIPVRIETRITELGTLEVWCVSRDGSQRWLVWTRRRLEDYDGGPAILAVGQDVT